MRGDLSATLVGLFFLGAVALGVGAFLTLAKGGLLEESGRLAVFVDDSVSGLEEGAPVQLRGVSVGRVAKVDLLCDMEARKVFAIVRCSVRASVRAPDRVLALSDRDTLRRMVDRGLRARIALSSITGRRHVALDFYEPEEYPKAEPPPWAIEESELAVPAARSTLSEFTDSIAEVLSELKDADVAAVVSEASRTLTKSSEALESLRAAADSVGWLVGPNSGVDRELLRTLARLAGAAEAVERLADYLERHPEALLTGRDIPSR